MDFSKEDIAFIVTRLFALYFGVLSLQAGFQGGVFLSWPPNAEIVVAHAVAPAAIWFIAALILWYFAKPIARVMSNTGKEEISDKRMLQVNDLWGLAFAVVGLLVLTDALPNLLQIITYHFYKAPPEVQIEISASQMASIVAASAKIAIGALLLVGWKRISDAIRRFRKAGLERE